MSPRLAAALSGRIAAWRGPWPEGKSKAEAVVHAITDGRHEELGPLRLQLELEAIDEESGPVDPSDVVVTVPKGLWLDWLEEGDLPGDPPTGERWAFYCSGGVPDFAGPLHGREDDLQLRSVEPGHRCYIVAHGKLRGWAPIVDLAVWPSGKLAAIIREAGAVACTVDEPIRGFRGWRYRWWPRAAEREFPEWRTP